MSGYLTPIMADEPNGVPEYDIEASNEGNGQPTSKKKKARASQNESQCECKDNTRSLICPEHGEPRWLMRK